MEFRQIQYYVSAATYLNFTKAAKEWCIVPSAMTQQITALEKELGVALFRRDAKTISLTPEGEVFLTGARKILKDMRDSIDMIEAMKKGYSGTLRIGCQGSILRDALPVALAAFKENNPGVELSIRQGGVTELLDELEKDNLDIVLSVYYPQMQLYQDLKIRVLKEEKVRLMLPANHELAGKARIRVKDLGQTPIILLKGDEKHDKVIEWAERGTPLKMYGRVDHQSSLEALVAAGMGASFVITSACRPHPGICYKDIWGMKETMKICLLSRENTEDCKKKMVEEMTCLLQEN